MKIYREQGIVWNLSDTVHFEPMQVMPGIRCFYDIVGWRCPKMGEHYLSGALVEAWLAPQDLLNKYLVVVPTYKAVATTVYIEGEPVKRYPNGHIKTY